MWLRHLTNLDESGRKSWGSAVLTFLIRDLCRNVDASRASMGGCCLFLQAWVWFRMPTLRPQLRQPTAMLFPLLRRWTTALSHTGLPESQKEYRFRFDTLTEDEFVLTPYDSEEIRQITPPDFMRERDLWISIVPLLNYEIYVWHSTDRVLRQFGYVQNVPPPPQNMVSFHNLTRHGKTEVDWAEHQASWIALWAHRFNRRPEFLQQFMVGGHSVAFNYDQ
ncbi:MAIN-LIKE 3 [Hibiscus trionum]|uniref:MAIN-LIKE 3 n=1 Tax=Hibiscus trionum TaxID=183268 RepID=A0A9W7M0V6_HIBTR|nr:MAIN-LIKE 3 [Hibiscus trionum]